MDLSKIPESIMLIVKKADLEAYSQLLLNVNDSKRTSTASQNEIMTIDEVASFLHLARQTIYGLTSRRAIPFYKKNKQRYFKRSELLAWIEEGKKKTQVDFDDELANYLDKKKGGKHG